jgi:MFS family permease
MPNTPPTGPWSAARENARFMMRALAYPNYRLFFVGQIVSLIGTWLTTVATSWLVYRLCQQSHPAQAALFLGIVGFASQIPVLVLSPVAGVWVDRRNRHRILIMTQTISMLQSFALAALALPGVITIPEIVALNLLQGAVNALDMPARQAFVVELIEKREDLSNAIALNSSMVHTARLVGPAVAGVLIYTVGEGLCFLLDGISYLAVIAALLAMRVQPIARKAEHLRAFSAFKEGLRYAFGFMPIRTVLLLVAVTSLMSMSQSVLMPIFAGKILGGQERTLGLLLSASGCGALVGSLYLASRRSVIGLGRVIAICCCVLGVGLILFAMSRHLLVSLPILFLTGFAMVVQLASSNTILQTIVDDDKRGRVMSLFAMCFMGMTPFGSLMAGAVADVIGAPWTLAGAGSICLVAGLLFIGQLPKLRPLIRPIYVRKGVLPEVAEGLKSATGPAATHE